MSPATMELKVLVPERVLLEASVVEVVAEGVEGSFGLLPRHVDYVAPLVPGILSYVEDGGGDGDREGRERFVATAEGVLVKRGREVLVSVRSATPGERLGELEEALRRDLAHRSERENEARRAASRLEADIVRRFVELHRFVDLQEERG